MFCIVLLYTIQHPKKWIQFLVWLLVLGDSLQSWRQQSWGAVNHPATHREPCHRKETAVPISSLNVSDWNLEAHKGAAKWGFSAKSTSIVIPSDVLF